MTDNESLECAYVDLRGAVTRLAMVINARSERNYETALKAVEEALVQYRGVEQSQS